MSGQGCTCTLNHRCPVCIPRDDTPAPAVTPAQAQVITSVFDQLRHDDEGGHAW